ncbi:MAG: hypothetical protein ACOYBY_13065 [Dermatophilaceae bacterium]
MVKLVYTPPTPGHPASLQLVDWWTPFTDHQRTSNVAAPQPFAAAWTPIQGGVAPAALPQAPPDAPANYLHHKALLAAGHNDAWGDVDLASGGPVLIDSLDTLLASGKDGISYILDTRSMGKTSPTDLQLANAKKNYAKLKSLPFFFTYYWPGADSAPDDIRSLNNDFGRVTHHQHGTPVVWHSPGGTIFVYCWGENGNLRAWELTPPGVLRFLANGAERASANTPIPPGGMPGGMICLSSDGVSNDTGVVWALIPYDDANLGRVAGRLLAYDATRFGTFGDGSSQLRVLWDSQQWNIQFSFNKFNRPVVCGGKLYVPTYNARVDVYGLA